MYKIKIMKSMCTKLFLFLLIGCCHFVLMAQDVEILESNTASSSIGIIGGYNRFPNFCTCSKHGFYTGLSYEMILGEEIANSKSSIIFRGMYESMPAFFEVPGEPYPSRLPDGTELVSPTRNASYLDYNMVTLEAVYKQNLIDTKFGFTVGPSVSIPVSTSIEKRFEFLQPNNGRFGKDPQIPDECNSNVYRTIVTEPKGEIKELHPFRLALKFGVHYELLLAQTIVVPHISYNYGLTNTSNVDGVRINALQAGVEVRFAF
jgi:hypothetical protein